jgi:RNA polymerase sigma-70 factor (ECF subfamily)
MGRQRAAPQVPSNTIPTPHEDDLRLAAGCAAGDARALELFHTRFGPAIRHAVRGVVSPALADEVTQRVLAKLFVAEPEGTPAITSYNGSAKLSTWVQVVARRMACNAVRSEHKHRVDAPREVELILRHAPIDHELVGDKRRYRATFKLAFEAAFAALSARERNLLRYECIDGLTLDAIARMHGVSVATIARWRARCRARLFRLTRDHFRAQASIAADEFPSVMKLIESQLDISLSRLFATTAA